MDPGTTLQTLADVSVAIVGFSAIGIALRAPQLGDPRTPANRWRLALLFSLGLGALLFALVRILWPRRQEIGMEASDELLTIAELAIGLAGFPGS